MKMKKHQASDEIPTSSMADIAFLLIIYFMVTATFAATRGLDFALPKDDDSPPVVEKEDSVLIEVLPGGSEGGEIRVDSGELVVAPGGDVAKILEYLSPKLERNPKKPVIIKPDPMARYGDMVKVFDVLRHGKIVGGKLVTRAQVPALSDEEWEEAKNINISIPTQREIDAFWF